MSQFEAQFSEIFVKKAPALPKNIKEFIVAIIPWLNLVGVIFAMPFLLALVGLSSILPFVKPYSDIHINFGSSLGN